MRTGASIARLLFALALALSCLLSPAPSSAQSTTAGPTDDITIYTYPPVPPLPSPVPDVAVAPEVGAFVGRTVRSVQVVIDDARWPERAPDVSELHSGDRLTMAAVRRALDEVLTAGTFADARVDATAEGSGVSLVIHVMPRRVIDEVRVDAHGAPIDTDDLIRQAELGAEGELVGREMPIHRARLDALLQRRGFPAPQVRLSTQPTDDPLRVKLLVDVIAGAPRRIERRVIYGIGGSEAERADAERFYAAKTGERADEVALTAADNALETRIRARGRHRAQVFHDVVLHRGLVVLRVRVDYGTQYETRYEGNDHYDKSTLDNVLALDEEADRSPNHLLQKLRDFYVKHGFLDVEARLEVRGEGQGPIAYYVFHVEEGSRVRVAGRIYPCLREADVKDLAEAPTSAAKIGAEIDSFLEEELPGDDLVMPPSPSGVDKTVFGPDTTRGAHPSPLELDPHTAYVPETYERALQHVQELYRAEGYLSAQVGPVQVLRDACDPRAPGSRCRRIRSKATPPDACTYDAAGMPLPVPALDPALSCVPDPAHNVTCAPVVSLRIPIKLGPRTQLWDVAFSGVSTIAPAKLLEAATTKADDGKEVLKLGGWMSTVRVEEARRHVADAYREEGYAFADVKYTIEPSTDRTRARVRFLVVEGEPVTVRAIVVRGNNMTHTKLIEKRIALKVGQPYRASLVRATEEAVATLGPFASVNVSLDNPYVPQKNKTVIVTVVERPRQSAGIGPGFSTGEGLRLTAEYEHRNLWGNAISLSLRGQLAYIPTPFIIDPVARENYRNLPDEDRIGFRLTASLLFPEIGLGPQFRSTLDGLGVHDLQRDFYVTRFAAIPGITWRPRSQVQVTLSQSAEFNLSRIFRANNILEYLQSRSFQGQSVTDLARQLNVPDGATYAFAQRVLVSWDRRDNAPNATHGTLVALAVEHVDAFPTEANKRPDGSSPPQSHFFKVTPTFSGYIPLPKGIRIAAQTRFGFNYQLTDTSATYPDRLFFMGGVDTMRGWNLNSFIPQDDVDRIFADRDKPDFVGVQVAPAGAGSRVGASPRPEQPAEAVRNISKFTPATRPIRGGNLMVIERIEIRIPIKGPLETVLFTDIGNLWIDPSYPFTKRKLPLRADVGTGIRVQTPVGPLAVDYGINVDPEPYEDFGAINFAIGLF